MIGLTGALLAYSAGFISPTTYSFDRVDVRVLVLVAFGGLGTLLGPVIGAGVFAILDEQLTTSLELREVLYGVFVIAIFLFFRRGVVATVVGRSTDSPAVAARSRHCSRQVTDRPGGGARSRAGWRSRRRFAASPARCRATRSSSDAIVRWAARFTAATASPLAAITGTATERSP